VHVAVVVLVAMVKVPPPGGKAAALATFSV
jgi:hypothetical protein